MKIPPSVSAIPFDGGLVLLDGRANRLFAYNQSAALVWAALADGASPGQALCDAYDIAPAQADADANAIIAHWQAEALVGDARPLPVEAAASFRPLPDNAFRACYRIGGHVFAVATAHAPNGAQQDGVLGAQRSTDSHDMLLEVQIGKGGEFALWLDGAQRLRSRDAGEIAGAIFQSMLDVLHGSPDWLAIIHGAAVLGDKGALVLAGPSGSGKSTLAAWLSMTGFRAAADDMAALLAPDGRLAPWPVARSIKRGSWPVLRAVLPELDSAPAGKKGETDLRYLPVDAVAWNQPPLPVQALLFPTYARGDACTMTPLAPLDALQRLLQDRLWIGYPLRPDAVRRFLAWLEQVPAHALRYDDLEAAGRCLGAGLA